MLVWKSTDAQRMRINQKAIEAIAPPEHAIYALMQLIFGDIHTKRDQISGSGLKTT